MGYAEKRGDYWRGRYKIEPGRYGTVSDAGGKPSGSTRSEKQRMPPMMRKRKCVLAV